MIRLDATTRTLKAVLAGAVTTSQLACTVAYSDAKPSAYPGASQMALTNSTTAVTICDAPPLLNQVRDIDYIAIYNRDTVPATVTVSVDDGGTLFPQVKATLVPGAQLVYTHAAGWQAPETSVTITTAGLYAARPSAAVLGAGNLYIATDIGNEVYLSDGTAYTVVGGGGSEIGYAEIVTSFTTTSTSPVDVAGLSLNVKIPETPIVLTYQGSSGHSVANGFVIVTFVANGVVQSAPAKKSINAGDTFGDVYECHIDPVAAGLTPGTAYVFKVQISTHPSTAGTVTLFAAASPRQTASLRANLS